MSKQNPYHVTIKNLETSVTQKFILQRPKDGFNITGADTRAPKYINGAVSYGDFTNHSVFAQANWSGGSGFKYFNPEVVGYQVQPYSNKFYLQSGFNVSANPGEIRMGANAKAIASFLSSDESIVCFHQSVPSGYLFCGTNRTSSCRVWKSTDNGATWAIFFDSATEPPYVSFSKIKKIISGKVSGYDKNAADWRDKSAWSGTSTYRLFFLLGHPTINDSRVIVTTEDKAFDVVLLGESGYALSGVGSVTVDSVPATLAITATKADDSSVKANQFYFTVTNWNGATANDLIFGQWLEIEEVATGTKTNTMFVGMSSGKICAKALGRPAGSYIIRKAPPSAGNTGNGVHLTSAPTSPWEYRSPDNVGMNGCVNGFWAQNTRTKNVCFVISACSQTEGPSKLANIRDRNWARTSDDLEETSTLGALRHTFYSGDYNNVITLDVDVRNTYTLRYSDGDIQAGDSYVFYPFPHISFGSAISDIAIHETTTTTKRTHYLVGADGFSFSYAAFPLDSGGGIRAQYSQSGKICQYDSFAYLNDRTTHETGIVHEAWSDKKTYITSKAKDGSYSCTLGMIDESMIPTSNNTILYEFGEKEITAIVQDGDDFYIATGPKGRIYLYSNGTVSLLKQPEVFEENNQVAVSSGCMFMGMPCFTEETTQSIIAWDKVSESWRTLLGTGITPAYNRNIPAIITAGERMLIATNYQQQTFYFDETEVADSGYLISSWYDAQMPGIDKKALYVTILTYPFEDDTQSLRMAVQLDFDTTWYYLPTTIGGSWNATPGTGHNITYDEDANARAHNFFFPYNTPKWKKLRYKIEASKGATYKPVIATIDLFYILTEKKEVLLSLSFPLNDRQELINKNIDVNVHREKLAFLQDIWDNDSICEITFIDGLSYKAIPFKPDMLAGGGLSISYNNVENKRFDDREMSYMVNMIFKSINLLN